MTTFQPEQRLARAREKMVKTQLVDRNIQDPAVINAMGAVPREQFLPKHLQPNAYEDRPLPISDDQTISQPYIVAFMIEALHLKETDSVLEVGTGSGYAAAVLANVGGQVFSIERHQRLARSAEQILRRLKYQNIHVRCGDGTLGWPQRAPFDAIVVAASGPAVPVALRDQLKIGGRLVLPIGQSKGQQSLVRVTRVGPANFQSEELADVRFVDLIGVDGWPG